MGLLSFLHRQRLSPSWTFTPGGIIWRLHIARDGRIVGENRDITAKSVRFFCIDGRTGTVIWTGLALDEPWWAGIETLHENLAVLHEFVKPDMPDHQGIHAVDLGTGKVLWSRRDVTYWFGYQKRLYGTRQEGNGRKVIVFDAFSGEIVEELSDDHESLAALQALSQSEDKDENLEYAEMLGSEETGKGELSPPFLRNAVGNVEVIRVGERVVFGWYVPAPAIDGSPRFHHHVTVLSRSGETEFETIVHSDARVPLPDTFFVHGGTLYFIRQERTLEAMPLLESK